MPAKPKSPFPKPAAVLPGEADILAKVIADLSDHTAKLVYADWLEERDDPRGPLLRNFIQAHQAGKKLSAVKSAPRDWRRLIGITSIQMLHGTDLASRTDTILALARPAIDYLTPNLAEKSLAVGASKFGGRPELPEGTKWPKFENQPVSFLGQLNLAELQASPVARDLPATGLVSVFCRHSGMNDADFPDGSWRLFYFPDTTKLARDEFPEELAEQSRFQSCRVQFAETLTVPPWKLAAKELRMKAGNLASDTYNSLYYGMCGWNRILGHEYPVDDRNLAENNEQRHLLTICGNSEAGWEFGQCGAIYWVIDKKRLKAGKLDRVKLMVDC